jgi:NAD-dependent SIR2 family protein deacetylase
MLDEKVKNEIDQLRNHILAPNQTWLFGAGISCKSGIPLMIPLTKRIAKALGDDFSEILNALCEKSHVEQVLSQIADMIVLAERTKDKTAILCDKAYDKKCLESLYNRILVEIRSIIKNGYLPGQNGIEEKVGSDEESIVQVDDHRKFVRALFHKVRANLEIFRPHVNFFTTNYDTLLEDALALERIESIDCFSGGAIGYWNPIDEALETARAAIYKLHGSIDWYFDNKTRHLFRYRDSVAYSATEEKRILIYPQSTKYIEAQKDPFAYLFDKFRKALTHERDNSLIICGYSFNDDHINSEIENALTVEKNNTNIVIFVYEENNALPNILSKWLQDNWKQRVFIATNKGFYHGSTINIWPSGENEHEWWTFQGVINLLENQTSLFGNEYE